HSKGGRWWAKIAQRLPVAGDVILGLLLAVLFAMALYPMFAIPGKLRDRWNPTLPPSLNGMVFMDYLLLHENEGSVPLATDAEVIRWLQENVEGSPVIMEKNAEIEYIRWGNRMSIYTGLPTVVGWRWHQAQQRMVMPPGTVESRQQDVADFYTTPDAQRAWQILEKYDVSYVVVTPYEEIYMTTLRATAKFDELVGEGRLEVAFETSRQDAVVYRVIQDD
ncbi:MAG: hypothetical protein ACP5GX_08125, partial [Anaerolineae bacterium]